MPKVPTSFPARLVLVRAGVEPAIEGEPHALGERLRVVELREDGLADDPFGEGPALGAACAHDVADVLASACRVVAPRATSREVSGARPSTITGPSLPFEDRSSQPIVGWPANCIDA